MIAIADEESGADGALDPRETGAIHAAQFVVVDRDEDHERDEQQRTEPRAPAAEPRDQQQNAGERFEYAQPYGRENAQRFGNSRLGEPYAPRRWGR